MRGPGAIVALIAAIAIGAAWPLAAHRAPASASAAAPLPTDYRQRNATVAFYEAQLHADPDDQITRRMLGGEYLQRFRESGDLNDVSRAAAMARGSLQLQPYRNVAALSVLASSDVALHRFAAALREERAAVAAAPFDDNTRAQVASTLMETGRYQEAGRILSGPHQHDPNPTWMSIRARYDEVTGNLAGARVQMVQATTLVDASLSVPAYTRSWYHLRQAQLAFEAGDSDVAAAQFEESLRDYPDNAAALLNQAKFYRARGEWRRALDAAQRSADLYPLPQALGYVADAHAALGDAKAARRTDALIRAEQRLFNTQGVNDRLLAMYYAEHGERLNDALHAARSDVVKRGDEIYADDTMAWVLAALGRWQQARTYAVRAVRYETQDPEVQYHAAVIAAHTGHKAEARYRLRTVLSIDPRFHPFYAAVARRMLEELGG